MKRQQRLRAALVTICWVLVAAACGRQPSLFPSGDGALRASCDSLRFDTLFSGLSSTTAWMRIYNASAQPLRIDSVYLLSGGGSGFRASVDAFALSESRNLSIPAGDSLFVFVELTAPEQQQPGPCHIEDKLCFAYGDERLDIVLDAYAWDAVMWRGKTIDVDTLLRADKPYVIYDSLTVAAGACLRLDEGVTLHFHDGAALMVYGSLQAKGSAQHPVVLRGDRLDWAFDDFPYEWYPGQWTGVYLGRESYDNSLDFTHIRGAYYGIISDSSSLETTKLTLSNSQLFNMIYSGIYALSTKMEVSNTLMANSGSYTVALIGGDAVFTHCTIANYQVLTRREDDTPSLVVVNFTQDNQGRQTLYPLQQASFRNCIVYGSRQDEFAMGLLPEAGEDISFQSCLLRKKDTLDATVASAVIYNLDPCFKAINNNYRYDFHLDSLSPAINAANPLFSTDLPLDADGLPRLQDESPDMGAFEYALKAF